MQTITRDSDFSDFIEIFSILESEPLHFKASGVEGT